MEEDSRKEVIRQLFEEHADGIYRYVSYSLPSHIDARDVVQEVFLRAYQGWDGFQHKSSPKTWLYRIARNYIYDLLRKQYRETSHVGYLETGVSVEPQELQTMVEYEDVLRQLPDLHRQVVVLRAVEGLNVRDTARILGCSEGSVRLIFYRARKRLQRLLSENTTPGMRGEVQI
jgi:RNA polymerase sigma-70 factor (ECF subfamily)